MTRRRFIDQYPDPNVGQLHPGAGYTVLRGGQDVRQPGWYFNETTQELRSYRDGDILPGGGDIWDYLTGDRAASLEALIRLIRERGWAGDLSAIHFKPPRVG